MIFVDANATDTLPEESVSRPTVPLAIDLASQPNGTTDTSQQQRIGVSRHALP